jgi:hypothetical protein
MLDIILRGLHSLGAITKCGWSALFNKRSHTSIIKRRPGHMHHTVWSLNFFFDLALICFLFRIACVHFPKAAQTDRQTD